eukprot:scaffold877_cov154-Amphora_coffeaeformis.AAC.5
MVPKVVQDPRFRAGRSLVQKGKAAPAVEIFASLLEEARTTFGEDSIESAPAYYEYGNALLRHASSEEGKTTEAEQQALDPREAAAKAAEQRLQGRASKSEEDHKPSAKEDEECNSKEENEEEEQKEGEEEEAADDSSDVELALEMMETAWSILDEYVEGDSPDKKYLEWATEQSPRYLTGIGDALSVAGRHPDAADAYSRALEHRLELLKAFVDTKEPSPAYLKCRRLIVEANILIAEEFLACPEGEDVVTTETKDVLVKAAERVDYAKGYYDKARDELQETVLLMGEMAAKGIDVTEEKEDICFVSTMVMGVGMKLADLDEAAQANAKEPAKKKSKRTQGEQNPT